MNPMPSHSLFSAIDADPDLGDEEKEQAKTGLWSEALETALTSSLGWAIEHLPDLWRKRRGWMGAAGWGFPDVKDLKNNG